MGRISRKSMAVLTDLCEYRVLSLSQVDHLHFTNKRYARKKIQELLAAHLIDILPVNLYRGTGRPEGVYGIGKEGHNLLSSSKEIPDFVSYEQSGAEDLLPQVEHQILINWFRIHLHHITKVMPGIETEILSCNSPFRLDPENGVPFVRDHVLLPGTLEPTNFIPDLVFTITDTERERTVLFFLEADRGTEPLDSSDPSRSDVRGKILCYQEYFRSARYKRYEGIRGVSLKGFRLLFLTSAADRMKALCFQVRSMPPSDFVWVSSQDRMFTEGVSGNIWARGGRLDAEPDSILGSLARPMPLPPLE